MNIVIVVGFILVLTLQVCILFGMGTMYDNLIKELREKL